ncbi:MAG: hypothetical protein WC657_00730 [Candidatus Paceibacterota bacterium]|jgi:hypothetical protein
MKQIIVLSLVLVGGSILSVAVDKVAGVKVGIPQTAFYMLWGAAIFKSSEWMCSSDK